MKLHLVNKSTFSIKEFGQIKKLSVAVKELNGRTRECFILEYENGSEELIPTQRFKFLSITP